ncbi:MAG: hypothetical protein HQL62_10285, partial [Magnetococcales bacterium]|nr:hypothetical protein [Magnetococcales bacterium]
MAATGAICAEVVRSGLPLAVAWPAVDQIFLQNFFQSVAEGSPIERSLNRARQLCRLERGEQHPPTWTLPMLYGGSQQGYLFNVAAISTQVHPLPGEITCTPLPGMHAGVTGLFHGRRLGTLDLPTALREGGAGLVHISGPNACGKSTLALRWVREAALQKLPHLVVSGTPANPITAARLVQCVIPVLKRLGRKVESDHLKDGSITLRDRLVTLVDVLTRRWGILLLLDNLDPWPTTDTRDGGDADLAWFFSHFLQSGPGKTRILVTGPTAPQKVEPWPSWVRLVVLDHLTPDLLAGIGLCERSIFSRLPPGPSTWAELGNVCQLAHGHPAWMRPLLSMHPEQLAQAPQGDPLVACFAHWPAAERVQLAMAALPNLALPTAGMVELTGTQAETLADWRETGFLATWSGTTGETLWKVPAEIGSWLAGSGYLPVGPARQAHRRIGAYLIQIFEDNHEDLFGLTWVDILMEARYHWMQADDIEMAAALSGKISHGLEIQGLFAELERINRQFLAWGSHPSPCYWIAQSCLGRGELEQAQEWFQRSREAAGDRYPVEQAVAWQGEAEIHLAKGRLDAAREGFQAAMELLQGAGDLDGEASMAARVAALHVRQGAPEKATTYLQHALTLQEKAGDRMGAARTLSRLAEVDMARHDFTAAVPKLRAALAVQTTVQDHEGESTSHALWGMLEMQRERPEQAVVHFARAIVLYQEMGHMVDLASTLPVAGHLLYTLERFSESRQYFTMALPLLRHLGQNAMLARVQHQLGVMDLLEDLLESAMDHLREALQLRGQIADRQGEAATLCQLGWLARRQGLAKGA